jgi:hypothetical protein
LDDSHREGPERGPNTSWIDGIHQRKLPQFALLAGREESVPSDRSAISRLIVVAAQGEDFLV